jgi:lipopolysaccharide/colanic/teichoic acid biosynthesis glycosyltransferase
MHMKLFIKRAVDIAGAAIGLIVCAPVIALVAFAIRLDMGAPVLFWQQRPGLGGKPFILTKFRTMRDAHRADGQPLPDSERLTPLGRFLRATTLDELPELWNVLRGDMSLVGPRPLLMRYLNRYTPQEARRHEVRPGLTGWAQINGRNAISWPEKFALDVWYVDHWSVPLDMKIIFITILKVLQRHGINAEGEATMPEFGLDREEAG